MNVSMDMFCGQGLPIPIVPGQNLYLVSPKTNSLTIDSLNRKTAMTSIVSTIGSLGLVNIIDIRQ